jgi:lipopolysaccharide assembly protein A
MTQPPHHVIKRTRMGGLWIAVGSFAVVLLLLLVFILENLHRVDIAFFGAHGHLPLGVAMLLAAVLGVLLVAIPAAARIVQLRATARRHRRADAGRAAAGQERAAAAPAGAEGQRAPR